MRKGKHEKQGLSKDEDKKRVASLLYATPATLLIFPAMLNV